MSKARQAKDEERRARYATPFPPRLSLEIAKAAYANAKDYLAEALLLRTRRRAGRASALAILGMEEFGKALYFAGSALGFLRDKPRARQQMFEDHPPKQAMSRVTAAVPALARAFTPMLRKPLAAVTLRNAHSARQQIRQLEQSLVGLIRHLEEATPPPKKTLAAHAETTRKAFEPRLSLVRARGFYVGLSEDRRVLTPRQVSRSEATVQIRALRRSLRQFEWIATMPPSYAGLSQRIMRLLRPTRSPGHGTLVV